VILIFREKTIDTDQFEKILVVRHMPIGDGALAVVDLRIVALKLDNENNRN
jgi:hypothetical protein